MCDIVVLLCREVEPICPSSQGPPQFPVMTTLAELHGIVGYKKLFFKCTHKFFRRVPLFNVTDNKASGSDLSNIKDGMANLGSKV